MKRAKLEFLQRLHKLHFDARFDKEQPKILWQVVKLQPITLKDSELPALSKIAADLRYLSWQLFCSMRFMMQD